LFALLLLCACERGEPANGKAVSPALDAGGERYLALGDSFTIGTGSPSESAFPARLTARFRESRCAVDLRNVAVNGFTTDDLIEEELPELGRFRPTFVTVAIGANDIVRGRSEDAYRGNVRRILEAVKVSGVRQILVLPQPDWSRSPVAASFGDRTTLDASIRRFNAILAEEAKASGATWMDLSPLMQMQAEQSLVAGDGLHPSASAYDAWAEAIAREIPPPCVR
jgi:acyl-CoA thioesterase-1